MSGFFLCRQEKGRSCNSLIINALAIRAPRLPKSLKINDLENRILYCSVKR